MILPSHDSFILKFGTEKKPYDILLSSMELAFKDLLGVKQQSMATLKKTKRHTKDT